jgi:putative transposase
MSTFSKIWIHAIWTTKNCEPVLHKNVRFELFNHIKKEVALKDIYIDTINGIEDHVHCLFQLKTTQSVSFVMQEIKGGASYWANGKSLIEGGLDWQKGYGAFSVSDYNVPKVRNYIYNQEIHHQKYSFQSEMDKFKLKIE